jgi:hypothetical protein
MNTGDRMARIKLLGLILVVSMSSLAQTVSPTPEDNCPIGFHHLDLRYNHAGGESKPQINLSFINQTQKKVAVFTISLSLLDSAGYANPYGKDLNYRAGADPGKKYVAIWTLQSPLIDMHHTGEIVYLQKVDFSDGTRWTDPGSLICKIVVDYHPQ